MSIQQVVPWFKVVSADDTIYRYYGTSSTVWNNYFSSNEVLSGNGSMKFQWYGHGASNRIIGLIDAFSSTRTDVLFSFQVGGAGSSVFTREGGTVVDTGHDGSDGDTYEIRRTGTTIEYLVNDVVERTLNSQTTADLFVTGFWFNDNGDGTSIYTRDIRLNGANITINNNTNVLRVAE